jgi:hypothetical protein
VARALAELDLLARAPLLKVTHFVVGWCCFAAERKRIETTQKLMAIHERRRPSRRSANRPLQWCRCLDFLYGERHNHLESKRLILVWKNVNKLIPHAHFENERKKRLSPWNRCR